MAGVCMECETRVVKRMHADGVRRSRVDNM